MKKLVLVLLVAVLSVPAFAADPNITIGVVGTTVTVGYTADSADLISGMGLTVQLSSGAIGNFTDLQGDTGKYNIHPCSIVIDGSVVTDYNTPIYSGGNGGTSVVVEYGALYVGDANAPATAGNLFSFNVVGGTSPVTVTVSANHAGGIVTEALVQSNIVRTKNVVTAAPAPTITTITPATGMYNTTVAVTIAGTNFAGSTVKITKAGSADIAGTAVVVGSSSITCNLVLPLLAKPGAWDVVVTNSDAQTVTLAGGFTVAECYKSTSVAYAAWVSFGRPDCWCYQRNCRGDINGVKNVYWVSSQDLTLFKAAFTKNDAALLLIPNGLCADNNRTKNVYWVSSQDLTEFKKYFTKNDTITTVCNVALTNGWKN